MLEIENKIGYEFTDRSILNNALTHSSYANENKSRGYSSNERLEFLGDSVLGQVTATYLFKQKPEIPEGNMSKLRSELVCEGALYKVACELDLGKYILLGKGEELTGGRQRTSILADAVEAIIAAIYLDGGFDEAKKFIMTKVLDLELVRYEPSGDYKSELQELIQKKPNQKISYVELEESGPDHDKSFRFGVYINDILSGEGEGKSKKEAEQAAARAALEGLDE